MNQAGARIGLAPTLVGILSRTRSRAAHHWSFRITSMHARGCTSSGPIRPGYDQVLFTDYFQMNRPRPRKVRGEIDRGRAVIRIHIAAQRPEPLITDHYLLLITDSSISFAWRRVVFDACFPASISASSSIRVCAFKIVTSVVVWRDLPLPSTRLVMRRW